jgi:hypothetical protein
MVSLFDDNMTNRWAVDFLSFYPAIADWAVEKSVKADDKCDINLGHQYDGFRFKSTLFSVCRALEKLMHLE